MSRTLSRKNNLVVPFLAAFVGMLVAVPVAVTASVIVAKASIGQGQTELAYAVSELSRRYDDRALAAPAYAAQQEDCVGRAEHVKNEEKQPTVVYVPIYRDRTPDYSQRDNFRSAPAAINNITTTTEHKNIEVEDSNIHVDKETNVDSNNVTINKDSQNTTNNSHNSANLAGGNQKNNTPATQPGARNKDKGKAPADKPKEIAPVESKNKS